MGLALRFFIYFGRTMKHDQTSDPDSLAEIWRRAEHRRFEDVRAWLARLFEPRALYARVSRAEGKSLLR
jgi:hypothetical protein